MRERGREGGRQGEGGREGKGTRGQEAPQSIELHSILHMHIHIHQPRLSISIKCFCQSVTRRLLELLQRAHSFFNF